MLLFNPYVKRKKFIFTIFQNISCYCLTGRKGDKNGRNIISKHLMLLFNLDILKTFNDPDLFQNISCYCLTQRA